ncbi:MAG TPA: hypothetical protein VE326_00680 [Candidatus Binatia bacterium]|nr:hypothetical protein [Candidatus Binatia bacterium]
MRSTRLSVFALVLSLACGCASNKALTRHALGTPESGGLAVLRTVLNADYKASPMFDDLIRKMTLGELKLPQSASLSADVYRLGETRARGGTPFEGVITFPNLEPGTYVLRSLEQPREVIEHFRDWQVISNSKEYRLDGKDGAITFEVRAGQPVFIGTLELSVFYDTNVLDDAARIELDANQYRARFLRSRDDEIRAWDAFLRRAPDSPWAPILKERLEWLRAQATRVP